MIADIPYSVFYMILLAFRLLVVLLVLLVFLYNYSFIKQVDYFLIFFYLQETDDD